MLASAKMVTGISRNQKIKTRKIIKNKMKKTNEKKRNSSSKKIKKISGSSLENKEKNYQDIVTCCKKDDSVFDLFIILIYLKL